MDHLDILYIRRALPNPFFIFSFTQKNLNFYFKKDAQPQHEPSVPIQSKAASYGLYDICSLRAARALDDVKCHFLTLVQVLKSVP